MTTIQQKKFANRHAFTFNLDAVNYTYKDGSGAGEINLPYSAIPKTTVTQVERPQWLLNLGSVCILIGAFDVGRALVIGDALNGTGAWILLGLLCIGLSRAFTVTYTVFQTHYGNVHVIRDRETHDGVIEELAARRKQYLRKAYDHVDTRRSVDHDLENFQWLRDEGVLTAEEFENRAEKARLAVRAATSTDGEDRYS